MEGESSREEQAEVEVEAGVPNTNSHASSAIGKKQLYLQCAPPKFLFELCATEYTSL